jgi:hypothetical protein
LAIFRVYVYLPEGKSQYLVVAPTKKNTSPQSGWKIFFAVSVTLSFDFAGRQAILREEGFAYARNSQETMGFQWSSHRIFCLPRAVVFHREKIAVDSYRF